MKAMAQPREKASNHLGAGDLPSGCFCPSILGDTILSFTYHFVVVVVTKPVSVDSYTCNQMTSKVSFYALRRRGGDANELCHHDVS